MIYTMIAISGYEAVWAHEAHRNEKYYKYAVNQ